MMCEADRPGILQRHRTAWEPALRFVVCCLAVVTAEPGRADAGGGSSASGSTTREITVTFSPVFGRAQADAICEILDRELVRGDGTRSRHGALAVFLGYFLAASVFLSLIVILTIPCRWFADAKRIRKYDARRHNERHARVRLAWWMGRASIIVLSACAAYAVQSRVAGTINRSAQSVAAGPRMIIVDPREEAGNAGESSLSYADSEPYAADLAQRVVDLLGRYGLRPIRLLPSDAGPPRQGGDRHQFVLHLHSTACIDVHVCRHPQVRADEVLDRLCRKIPGLTIKSEQQDAEVEACEVRYARSNPLSRIAADQACAVLKENGFCSQVVADPDSQELTRLSLYLPALLPSAETRLVLHRLPTQEITRLQEQLKQEGFHVEDRPEEKPLIPPGLLYYPSREVSDALAARQGADKLLQLICNQGFLGGEKQVWGVPAGRDSDQGYELSLVPLGQAAEVQIHCEREFYNRLRPGVVQTFGSGNYALNVSCTQIDGNPSARPGVIRFPHADDRIHAERLQAVLSEIVGLVDLQVAPVEEPQLDQIVVVLTYETNGAFHQFVSRLLETLASSDRDGLASFFTPPSWQQDPIAQAESAPSCRKVIPLRAERPEDDWRERFVRPWTFRLDTIRLQKDLDVGELHSVIRAERLLVCGTTDAGIRIEAVPEKSAADFVLCDKFDVVLTGGGRKLREILSVFDQDLREAPTPAGAQTQTIYYQEDSPEARAIARITQAILEDKGLVFAIEARALSQRDKVHVVAPATEETRDE